MTVAERADLEHENWISYLTGVVRCTDIAPGTYKSTGNAKERQRLLGDIQRLLAEDCVHEWLFQPQWVTVAKQGVRGLWKDMPIFVNDLSSLSWA